MNDHAANCPVGGNFACTCGYDQREKKIEARVKYLEFQLMIIGGWALAGKDVDVANDLTEAYK